MSRLVRLFVGSLIICAIAPGTVSAAGFTATLTIPSLCATPVSVPAFAIETSNSAGVGTPGGGAGAGKATIKPLVLTKAVDDCTPLLFKAAFTGQHFATAILHVGTSKSPILFTIQLTDLIVTDVKHEFSIEGKGMSDDTLMESITLDSAALSFTSGGITVQCNQATNTCQ
jgi:type VI protein secretion system component Hcp